MKKPTDCLQCIVLIVCSTIGLLIFKYHNKDDQLKRFYYEEHTYCYYLLTLIYTILVIGIVFNCRYFFNFYSKEVFNIGKKYIYKQTRIISR